VNEKGIGEKKRKRGMEGVEGRLHTEHPGSMTGWCARYIYNNYRPISIGCFQ